MFSQTSTISRTTSYTIYSRDEVIDRVKQYVSSKDHDLIYEISGIFRNLLRYEESVSIIMDLIAYFWTLEDDGVESIMYMLINTCANMNSAASQNVIRHIRILLGEGKLKQEKLLKIYTILSTNIGHHIYDYSVYLDISAIRCHKDNVPLLVRAIRETNRLTLQESTNLIKHLVEYLSNIELEACPLIVREILMLCDKNTFQCCIGAVVNFFNEKQLSTSQLSQSIMSFESKRFIEVQKTVIEYCLDIAVKDGNFIKELIKFCKASDSIYCIQGFMCVILLKLASVESFQNQIIELLKTCVKSCLNDNRLFIECAFVRESKTEHYDLNALMLHAVKFCSVTDREHISFSLIQLGFRLIQSGLPKGKVVTLKKSAKKKSSSILLSDSSTNDFSMNIQQKQGHAGIQMILHLFNKLNFHRQLILSEVIKFILMESHKPAVFVYLELLADLVALVPNEGADCFNDLTCQSIFELYFLFPSEVSLALLHALLPVIRYSITIRDAMLHIIVTNILSDKLSVRQVCVDSALVILKYFRITTKTTKSNKQSDDGFDDLDDVNFDIDSDDSLLFGESSPVEEPINLLTQCSQFACTQIASDMKPCSVDNSNNEEICSQILALLDEATRQFPDTKLSIYQGLVHVLQRNILFADQVIKFFLNKLDFVLDSKISVSARPPFLMDRIVKPAPVCQIEEPIAALISCLVEAIQLSSESYEKAELVLDNLIKSMSLLNPDEVGVSLNDSQNLRDGIISDIIVDVYDVLMIYLLGKNEPDKDVLERLLKNKEEALRTFKAEKRVKKTEYKALSNLSVLSRCFNYLFDHLIEDIKNRDVMGPPPPPSRSALTFSNVRTLNNNNNNNDNNNNSNNNRSILEVSINDNVEEGAERNDNSNKPTSLIFEKIAVNAVTICLSLVKQVGSPEMRITHRNRLELCSVLSNIVGKSLEYYTTCICSNEVLNTKGTLQQQHQRQLMKGSLELYCTGVNKVVQYFYKTIPKFLDEMCNLDVQYKKLQKSKDTTTKSITQFSTNSMTGFLKIHKVLLRRILATNDKRITMDAEPLLSTALNVAIFCGLNDDNTLENITSSNLVFGASKINIKFLNNFFIWLHTLLKHSKLPESGDNDISSSNKYPCNHNSTDIIESNNGTLSLKVVSILLTCARFVEPNAVDYLDKIVADMCARLSYYDGTQTMKIQYHFITKSECLIPEILNYFSMHLDEVDWMLNKWKASWIEIRQRKSVASSQLSSIAATPVNVIEDYMNTAMDQEKILNYQLNALCSIMTKLIRCNIKSVNKMQELVKLTTRLFNQLTFVVKQYIHLTRSKIGSFSTIFEKLIKSSGILSSYVSGFIVQLQKVQLDDCDDYEDKDKDEETVNENSKKGKSKAAKKKRKGTMESEISMTTKEIRLIPNMVYSIEQYHVCIIELQKFSKVNLFVNIKTMSNRDFHICNNKLQATLEANKVVDCSLSDIDDTHVEEAVDEEAEVKDENRDSNKSNDLNESSISLGYSPPRKLMRL